MSEPPSTEQPSTQARPPHASSPQRPSRGRRLLGALATLVACLGILGAAFGAIVVINRTEPTAKQVEATRKSAALVNTVTARRGTYRPRLVVLGTVQAARSIVLAPRVQGQVVELSPRFMPGGMVKKGEVLLRIDPADFENALRISQSELAQRQASLEIEKGRQSLAKKEMELLAATIDDSNQALMLRAPQLASIKAEVSAAEAAVERAELDLSRTEVTAPFDAQIISQSVNLGSQVSPGNELGQLVGVQQYWITAAVPVRSLRWVQFPGDDQPGSPVIIRNPDAWAPGVERSANVSQLIGAVDQQTRLARVMITVTDPLGRQSDTPALILDSLVETEIQGRAIEDVVRLDRELVRGQDTVWVMADEKLQIREVTVEFRDASHAYIRDGLADGDEVVATTLATVAEGIGLRKIDETPVDEVPVDETPMDEAQVDAPESEAP